MSQNRTPPPPRQRNTVARAAAQPNLRREVAETRRVGDTDEVLVEMEEGQTSIPVDTTGFPIAQRPTRRLSGVKLSDVTGRDALEASQGIGPDIVILHNGVTGAGTRGIGPLTRGKVVPLSALLGIRLTEALLDEDFEPEEIKERDFPRRARALMAHYLGPLNAETGKPEDPAFREARPDERGLSEVIFAENEGELEQALDDREEVLALAQSENEQMRDIIQRMARGEEVSPEELTQFADLTATLTGGTSRAGVSGASPEARMNPDDPTPRKTGEENPRQRDPGFVKQEPHDRAPSAEGKAGAGGNVTPSSETVQDESTLDEVFDPEAEA